MTQASAYWGIPDYYELTPRDFSLKVQGIKDFRFQAYKHDWEQTRFISWWSMSNELKNKIRNPRELMRFDWEGTKIDELQKQAKDREGIFPETLENG